MKASEWMSTRPRSATSTCSRRRSTDMPVIKDRYEGKSGSTQGERNESSPAENATSTPVDSVTDLSSAPQQSWPSQPRLGAVNHYEAGPALANIRNSGRETL